MSKRQNAFAIWNYIGNCAFVPGRIFPGYDFNFSDGFVLTQNGFDFTKFDAESANFYLLIHPLQKFYVSIREITGPVPVRYMRSSGCLLNQSAVNRSAVFSGWFQ